MKLPSFEQVLQDATKTFLRFPFVLITAAIGTIAAVILIDHEGPAQASILFKILFATILGLPLLTGFTLYAEKRKWGMGMSITLQLIGLLLLAAYGCTVPSDLAEAPAIHILRMIFFVVALLLFVTFSPYTTAGERNGFWQFNKYLLLRVIITGIYSMVLYAGLALALAALDNLFGMNVPGKRYPELWVVIVGLFTTWSFLTGVPEDLDQLEKSSDYPKIIKIFAQYILFPLVLVYLVILYAYLAKIMISWDWPQGWVSRLILGFASTGIFSFLLLYPVRDQTGNIWIQKASRWFNIVMIPLVVMLLLALWRRISEYGMTEGRYIAIVLGIWLGGIVLYFILSSTKSIKTIPVSLCVLALVTSFGPWGAFSVSEKSQVNRLEEYLTRNNILVNDRIQQSSAVVPSDDVRQISSILGYLHNIHGYDRIQPWFQQSLKEDSTGTRIKHKEPAQVAKMIGIDFVNIWYSATGNDIWLRSDQAKMIDIEGYDRMIRNRSINTNMDRKVFSDQEFQYRVNSDLDKITFIVTAEGGASDSLQVDLKPLFNRLLNDFQDVNASNLPPEKMMLMAADQNLKIRIYFRYINFRKEENVIKPVEYGPDILYRLEKR